MRLTGLLFAAAAALSMVAAPAFAGPPANPAAKLSLTSGGSGADVRAGAPMKKSSKFAFTAPTVLLGLAVVGTVVGIAVATSRSDNKPASA